MVQLWMTGLTLSVPVISTASLKPVMSISRFMMTALRAIRNVGQFARWSTLVSPGGPQPLIKILFVMLIVSLHADTCLILPCPMSGQPLHTFRMCVSCKSHMLRVTHACSHTMPGRHASVSTFYIMTHQRTTPPPPPPIVLISCV